MAGYKKVFSFQLRLRYLLASAFITALAFSSIVDAKAEENICYYSNPREFKSCTRKENKKIVPKYPLKINSQSARMIYFFIGDGAKSSLNPFVFGDLAKSTFNRGDEFIDLEISSSNGKSLTFISTQKIWSFWSGVFVKKFNSREIIVIQPEEIISWGFKNKERRMPGCFTNCKWSTGDFNLKYVDDYGNENILKGYLETNDHKGAYIVQNLFKNISKLENGSSRSRSQIINKKLINTQRRVDIISNIIKDPISIKDSCLEVNKNKYPDLVDQYKKLSKTINPLRSKINLGPSNTIKSICAK